jgi:glycosyltransferase involved in cell wall biosynthesis
MKKITVLFYAAFGKNTTFDKLGGAEAGCLRTSEILEKSTIYTIVPINKPVKKKGSVLKYFCQLFNVAVEIKSGLSSDLFAILHIAGFFRELIYFEYLYICLAKKTDHKVIYEIRNGDFIINYRNRGRIYKSIVKKVIQHSDVVLCQGSLYLDFVNGFGENKAFFYPNFIMDKYRLCQLPKKPMNRMNLIFSGRVVPAKNIEFIIDICYELKKMDLDFNLKIIGSYSEKYYVLLLSKMKHYELENKIEFTGRKSFEEMSLMLQKAHFFLFPSIEIREGHSNSLTEAMGCGVVPIASTAGFNEEVIGNDDLIIRTLKPIDYACCIKNIWKSNTWEKYAQEVLDRVNSNYTESLVKGTLLTAYNKIIHN